MLFFGRGILWDGLKTSQSREINWIMEANSATSSHAGPLTVTSFHVEECKCVSTPSFPICTSFPSTCGICIKSVQSCLRPSFITRTFNPKCDAPHVLTLWRGTGVVGNVKGVKQCCYLWCIETGLNGELMSSEINSFGSECLFFGFYFLFYNYLTAEVISYLSVGQMFTKN